MQLGAAMLHVDWLDGRTLGDWQFGVKLLCGSFPQVYRQLCAVQNDVNKNVVKRMWNKMTFDVQSFCNTKLKFKTNFH
jgi:hypothetical protein